MPSIFAASSPRRRCSHRAIRRAAIEVLEERRLLSTIPLPVIPAGTFNVTTYGAKGDGTTDNTTAIQNAINAASTAGGGTVEIPAGTFLSGPISLASKINLQLDSGAVLQAEPDGTYPDNSNNPAHFITVSSKNNVEISGSGTIDGNGSAWWTAYNANNSIKRPRLINITGSDTVWIHNVTLQNSPMFHVAFGSTNNVTIDSITISAPSNSPNTDGIDPAGQNYLIENSNISTGDDNIAIKPQGTFCSNITVTGMTFGNGHGMSVGGETNLGLNGLTVTNSTFNGTVAGIRLKAYRGFGGLVQNVSYSNLTMTNVQYPININSYYNQGSVPTDPQDPAQAVTATTPIWKNITISNVTSTNTSSSSYCGIIWGLPEEPVMNVALSNVQISAHFGMDVNHVRNLSFDSLCTITPQTGNDLISTKTAPTPFDAVVVAAGFTDQDINAPGVAGSSLYDPDSHNWTLVGGGADIGAATDQFNFASTNLTGDGTIVADVTSQTNSNAAAKAGVMIRNSTSATAAFASVLVTPSSGVLFQWRNADGGTVGSATVTGKVAPLWVKLVRQGNSFSAYYGTTGTSWTQIGSTQTVTMSSGALAGLADTSHDNTTTSTATFANVRMIQVATPASASPNPVNGTTSQLSALGADLAGESSLTYTWSATSIPSGASAPTFSANGTNAAKNVTATFSTPGSYTLQALIQDANGLSVTSSTTVTVALSTVTGTSGDDAIRLVRSGSNLNVYVNNSSTPAYSVPYSAESSISVNGGGGNDTITVDFSGGASPVPPGGLAIDGGSGTDSLTFTGTDSGDTASIGSSSVSFDGSSVAYTNIESINFNTGLGNDTLTQTAQPSATVAFNGSSGSDVLNVNAGSFTFPSDASATTASLTVNVSGGSVLFDSTQHLAGLNLSAAGSATVTTPASPMNPSVLNVTSLNFTGSSFLDLTQNELITTTSEAMIQSQITAHQIRSSSLTSSTALGSMPLTNGQVEVRWTLLGDANLDGTVGFADFQILAQNFNTGGTWAQGDFNGDGITSFADFQILAQNFNQSL